MTYKYTFHNIVLCVNVFKHCFISLYADADVESSSVVSLTDSQVSRSKAPDSEESTTVRRTRARATSTLTEENVTALNNTPARRTTRRNSGLLETNTPVVVLTPSRRSTRRSSITSEDNGSATVGRPRRNVNIDQTLAEENEQTPLKTPGRKRNSAQPEQEATPRKTPGRKSIAQPIIVEDDEEEIDEIQDSKTPRKSTVAPVGIDEDVIESTPIAASPRKNLSIAGHAREEEVVIEQTTVGEPIFATPPTTLPFPTGLIKSASLIEAVKFANQTPTKLYVVLDRKSVNQLKTPDDECAKENEMPMEDKMGKCVHKSFFVF